MKKRLIGFLLLLAMLIGAFAPVARADGDQLSEEERKKQEAESQAARISGLRDDLLLELSAKRGEADALMDDMISLDGMHPNEEGHKAIAGFLEDEWLDLAKRATNIISWSELLPLEFAC